MDTTNPCLSVGLMDKIETHEVKTCGFAICHWKDHFLHWVVHFPDDGTVPYIACQDEFHGCIIVDDMDIPRHWTYG